jgi:hypothetical protein
LKRVKSIELDHIQEKASQFSDKAKKAIDDIDIEKLNVKKQAIGAKISELKDKVRLKLKQIDEAGRQRRIDRVAEQARKEEEKKQRREARYLKAVNFLKALIKVLVLVLLVGIFLNIVF